MSADVEDRPFTKLELESVKPLRPDGEDITSLSIDSLTRYYAPFVVRLSPRRLGMKLKHLMAINDGTLPRTGNQRT